MRRKLILSIAAAALLVAAVAGSLILFDSGEGGFTKQAKSILSPVEETTAALADTLEATEEGKDLPVVGQTAGELEVATGKALDQAGDLDSSDRRQALLLDFLQATQAYARDVRAAGAKLTFTSASKAERAGREGETSRHELESADGELPLPGRDDFAAAEHLSTLAKRCGGVPPGSVALIGNRAITRAQLNDLVSQATTNYRVQGGTLPLPVDQYRILRRDAVTFLVNRIEFAESAEELGVTVPRDEVQQRLRKIKRQFFGNDEEAFRKQIARQHLTEAQVENDVRAQLIQERVYRKVSEGFRNKKARKRAWTTAMRKRFARKTIYRVGYAPRGAEGAPGC